MVTYALIHGAHHGAWCWDFFIPELEARGHRAVAVDLPVSDPTAGVSEYAAIAVDALSDVSDDVVVIGHSLGGIVAPVVAARRPVRRLIYVSGTVPEPGRSLAEQLPDLPHGDYGGVKVDNGDGTWSRPAAEAIRVYYHDCPEDRRQFAVARLRPQSKGPHKETSPLVAQPDVPTSYIVCTDDRAVAPARQRHLARLAGAETLEISGSHSPFMARPAELAELIVGLS